MTAPVGKGVYCIMTCRVLRIDEQLYGCEELPAGQPVLCDVLLADAAGTLRVLPYPDEALTAQNIQEGDTVALLPDGTLKKHPRSISFASMDECEFQELYKASLDVLWRWILSRSFNSLQEAENAANQLLSFAG